MEPKPPARGPPRIVHVTTVPMSLKFLTGQAAYMRARGLELHAVSSPGPELEAFGASEGVPVHAVEMPRRITPFQDLVALRELTGVLRRIRPDLVHAHTPKGGLLGMTAARLAGVPTRIYHVHGLPFVTQHGTRRVLLTTTERVSCGLATRVLAVSGSMRRLAVEEGICPAGKIEVLAGGSINGVDTLRFHPATEEERRAARERIGVPLDALVIGFVGRLVREKGVAELVEAFDVLAGEWPALHLVAVGPFEPQDPVPAAVVERLRGHPRIRLVGVDWDTPRLYAAMDVVTLPTYREGFPVVPLEAAAMGLPIVGTSVPGCTDAVLDGRTGTLVPPRDPGALAEALRAYLADPGLRAAHGASARVRVERDFAQDSVWMALHATYLSVLAAAGRSP